MDWQTRLINIYVSTCGLSKNGLFSNAERMSNNKSQDLTDEEIVTIFLNGIMTGRTKLKSIYSFTRNHLLSWFPCLGTYESFIRRLNRMSDVFTIYLEMISSQIFSSFERVIKLIDSIPIVMAGAKRSNRAKVARELAGKGYCESKKMFYYGVKIHIIALYRSHSLPFPEYIGLTSASCHDITAFKQIAPELKNCDLFGDKAYANEQDNLVYKDQNDLQIVTPIKLKKCQQRLDSADRLYSTSVSQIRQPIESLFNWLQEKTGIQIGSKIRSTQGLMVHTFGRITAGMLMLMGF